MSLIDISDKTVDLDSIIFNIFLKGKELYYAAPDYEVKNKITSELLLLIKAGIDKESELAQSVLFLMNKERKLP